MVKKMMLSCGCWLLFQLVPFAVNAQISEDKKFRRALTKEELAKLQMGETITKIHSNYVDIFHHNYEEGPLRVRQIGKNAYQFTPFGEWKQMEGDRLFATIQYTGVGREAIAHVFFPDGSQRNLMYNVPAVLAGDSVREHRIVYFKINSSHDTLAVQHSFWKADGPLPKRTSFWSYDAKGKHPVPPGWRLEQ